MNAALIGWHSGVWETLGLLTAIVVLTAAGCWFGAPPDTRSQILRGFARDLRRERAIRQWQREQRKVRVTR